MYIIIIGTSTHQWLMWRVSAPFRGEVAQAVPRHLCLTDVDVYHQSTMHVAMKIF